MRGSAPEDTFLKNNPVISPIDMSTCIISRTAAMIGGVIESLNSDGYQSEFCPGRASHILWQVECNLSELQTIVKLWFEAEKQQKKKGDNCLLSLRLDTTGLIEDLGQEMEGGAA